MKRIVLLFMTLVTSLPVAASHVWADIDLCEVYQDKLPPGLTLASLPEAVSAGAGLLNQYCTQCHNLPGPDRHTLAEWRDVVSRMFMLMEVSNRFGGLMGRVESMQSPEREILLAYLERHATNSVMNKRSADGGVGDYPWLSRTLTLFPFLLLTGVGVLRWRRNFRSNHKPCIID